MAKRGYGYEHSTDDADIAEREAAEKAAAEKAKEGTTALQARNWWNNLLGTVPIPQQKRYREKFVNPNSPTDDELILAYDEDHAPATAERAKEWWNGLNAAQRKAYREQYTDVPDDTELTAMYDQVHALDGVVENPLPSNVPTVQPATVGASATNPELMPNDAMPPDVPLYAGMPRRPPDALPSREKGARATQ
jgi:hypothetical protein